MLLKYSWHSKLPILGCFTAESRVLRLLYKGENAVSSNDLTGARCYFGDAAIKARKNGLIRLEMIAMYAAALAAEGQELIPMAEQYMDYAAGLSERLPAEDPMVEAVRCERERLTEQVVRREVESKLRVARFAFRIVEAARAEERGYDDNEPVFDAAPFDAALSLVATRLGYRHWLTALVLCTMADNCSDYSQSLTLYKRARFIALEYPQKAAPLLAELNKRCAELDGDSDFTPVD